MIQPQTYLTVADNSGAKKIMCIQVLSSVRYVCIFEIVSFIFKKTKIGNVFLDKFVARLLQNSNFI
jgi:ribosomal protein L14